MRKHNIMPRWNQTTGFFLQLGSERNQWVIGRTKERFRKILQINTKEDVDKLQDEIFGPNQ
jgi:hypothetical protein